MQKYMYMSLYVYMCHDSYPWLCDTTIIDVLGCTLFCLCTHIVCICSQIKTHTHMYICIYIYIYI